MRYALKILLPTCKNLPPILTAPVAARSVWNFGAIETRRRRASCRRHSSHSDASLQPHNVYTWASVSECKLGTCEASWFDSISNRTSDSRFDSYWWSDSKCSNRQRCQSTFVKKVLVVVKFVFKVDCGSKIKRTTALFDAFYDWIEINKSGCTVRLPFSPLGCVTACVVYGRFDSTFDSNEKKTIRRSLV